jgi:hypothetical protein
LDRYAKQHPRHRLLRPSQRIPPAPVLLCTRQTRAAVGLTMRRVG